MTYDEMYIEASQCGLSADAMRQNCRAQCCEYLRYGYFADKKARSRGGLWSTGAHWRKAARRCFVMLRWLDSRQSERPDLYQG